MKIINLFFLTAALLILFVNLSYSQGNDNTQKSPEVRARATTDKLDSKLTLTDSQDTMVYNAYKDFYTTLSSFYNEGSTKNKDEMKQLMDNARKDLDFKMSTILTPEQYDKYKDYQKEMNKNRDNSKRKNKD